MKNFNFFNGSDNQWEALLNHSRTSDHLNSYEWAKYLENDGWKTIRLINGEENNAKPLQGFSKHYPFKIKLIWFPNWIIHEDIDVCQFFEKLKSVLGNGFYYIRIRSHTVYNYEDFKMLSSKFSEPKCLLGSGYTMHLNLHESKRAIKSKFY